MRMRAAWTVVSNVLHNVATATRVCTVRPGARYRRGIGRFMRYRRNLRTIIDNASFTPCKPQLDIFQLCSALFSMQLIGDKEWNSCSAAVSAELGMVVNRKTAGTLLICMGRRFGKTSATVIALAAYLASVPNKRVVNTAHRLDLAQKFLDSTVTLAVQSGIVDEYNVPITAVQKSIKKARLSNGTRMDAWMSARGGDGDVLIIDEANFIKWLRFQIDFQPLLMQRGCVVIVISTPKDDPDHEQVFGEYYARCIGDEPTATLFDYPLVCKRPECNAPDAPYVCDHIMAMLPEHMDRARLMEELEKSNGDPRVLQEYCGVMTTAEPVFTDADVDSVFNPAAARSSSAWAHPIHDDVTHIVIGLDPAFSHDGCDSAVVALAFASNRIFIPLAVAFTGEAQDEKFQVLEWACKALSEDPFLEGASIYLAVERNNNGGIAAGVAAYFKDTPYESVGIAARPGVTTTNEAKGENCAFLAEWLRNGRITAGIPCNGKDAGGPRRWYSSPFPRKFEPQRHVDNTISVYADAMNGLRSQWGSFMGEQSRKPNGQSFVHYSGKHGGKSDDLMMAMLLAVQGNRMVRDLVARSAIYRPRIRDMPSYTYAPSNRQPAWSARGGGAKTAPSSRTRRRWQ